MNQTDQQASKKRFWNRVQIVMIFIVFTAPLLGAYFYKPTSFNNYGDIYVPVRVVENLKMQGQTGEVELDSFRRQWIFLVTAKNACDEACEANILKIRQLRFMQNQNMKRIRTVFLHAGLDKTLADDLTAKYRPVESYQVQANNFDQWTKILALKDVPAEAQLNRVYVIDPAGNLVLSYPSTAEPNSINKDIKRLLKTSQIG
jgi:hypothetical protein